MFDSDEESFFNDMLTELKEAGYVDSFIYSPSPYQLSEKIVHPYLEKKILKTKVKEIEKEQILLRAAEYTPDFKVYWTDKASEIFYQILEESNGRQISAPFLAHRDAGGAPYSVMEIKGTFDSNGSIRIFKDNRQKWVYQLYKEYVNLVIVPSIFEKLFVPEAYKLTPTGKKKKINFIVKELNEYVLCQKEK